MGIPDNLQQNILDSSPILLYQLISQEHIDFSSRDARSQAGFQVWVSSSRLYDPINDLTSIKRQNQLPLHPLLSGVGLTLAMKALSHWDVI